jgi:hypothetical protein
MRNAQTRTEIKERKISYTKIVLSTNREKRKKDQLYKDSFINKQREIRKRIS